MKLKKNNQNSTKEASIKKLKLKKKDKIQRKTILKDCFENSRMEG
jgi:hypothetical protein